MSTVDNWVLLTGWPEGDGKHLAPFVQKINDRLMAEAELPAPERFKRVDQYAGGNKVIEADVYALATNHADVEQLTRIIQQEAALADSVVQLLLKQQEDDRWRIVFTQERRD